MKKLITLGLILIISSCGRTNYKKSKTGILGPNSRVCEQREVCNVAITSKQPLSLTFSVSNTGRIEFYDVFIYDQSGNQVGIGSQIECSENLDCKEIGSYGSINSGSSITLVTTNYLPEGNTVRVFKR